MICILCLTLLLSPISSLVWHSKDTWFGPEGETIQVDAWGANSVRIRAGATISDIDGGLLPDKPVSGLPIEVNPSKNHNATLINGNIAVNITHYGLITVWRVSDKVILLQEYWYPTYPPGSDSDRGAHPRLYQKNTAGQYTVQLQFQSNNDHIYGMGQHPNGRLDQNGMTIDLRNYNTETTIPFYHSSHGYAFLWNTPSTGRVSFGRNIIHWELDSTPQVDYWVTTTATESTVPMYKQFLHSYADVTGHAPLLPHFASGFWQCKLRYRSQDEVLQIARNYTNQGLPLSVIVIDFHHWVTYGDWAFDYACWPNPKAMVEELNAMGVELMISFWPMVANNSYNYQPMLDAKYFVTETGTGKPLFNGYSGYIWDSTNAESRTFVWQAVKSGYFDFGIKVFWLDADEPQLNEHWPDHIQSVQFSKGRMDTVSQLYARDNQLMFYDGLMSNNITQPLTLSRVGWTGSQRYGGALWSGDIPSTFEMLHLQVRAGLNVMMSGIMWWTTDIGGFWGGNINNPVFKELIVRWFQFGAFCPLFRLHGDRQPGFKKNNCGDSGGPNELWSFGDTQFKILSGLLQLREKLRPVIMEQAKLSASEGLPIMRPMFVDFPDDPQCHEESTEGQYIFASKFLVSPVTISGATEWNVYLPVGRWVHWYTKAVYQGPQWVLLPTPLETFPLFELTLHGEEGPPHPF